MLLEGYLCYIKKKNAVFSVEVNNTPLAEIEKLVFLKFWNILVERISNNLLTSLVLIWNPRH